MRALAVYQIASLANGPVSNEQLPTYLATSENLGVNTEERSKSPITIKLGGIILTAA